MAVKAGSLGDLSKKSWLHSFNSNGSRISKEKILQHFLLHYGYGYAKKRCCFRSYSELHNQTSNWKFKLSLTCLDISNIATKPDIVKRK